MDSLKQPAPLVLVSSSPHLHCGSSVSGAMRDVLLALIPTTLAALWYFRLDALIVIFSCTLSAIFFEALCQKMMGRPVTIKDGSALLTGLLLAFCLPASLPPILAVFGGFCAIVIGKQVFGGLGYNIFNPAHIGRAILLASFPQQMTAWLPPVTALADAATSATGKVDAVTTATPLVLLRIAEHSWQTGGTAYLPELWQMFIGNTGGSLGETCAPSLLVGGLFLLWRGHIDWRIPVYYLGTVAVLTGSYGYLHNYDSLFALYHLCAGGLLIGAFFMATDWVTSPITKRGRIIYALGLGLLTTLIRLRGGYVEGVCYSILMMNMVTPLIDRYVRTLPFGGGVRHD
ncbi:MAG: RnfABCDGE type electron transport complex subunit D [Acidaminococcaceae bacterium]